MPSRGTVRSARANVFSSGSWAAHVPLSSSQRHGLRSGTGSADGDAVAGEDGAVARAKVTGGEDEDDGDDEAGDGGLSMRASRSSRAYSSSRSDQPSS